MSLQSTDRLITNDVHPPLLDEYMGSMALRGEVLKIAEMIKHAHLALLPSDTGNLKSTARVSAKRSTDHPDRRWYAEYEIGGVRAGYILPLEQEGHYLARALRSLGYDTGDVVSGPTGKIAPEAKRPATTVQSVEDQNAKFMAEREAESRANVRQATEARVREAGYEVGQTIRVRDPGDGNFIDAKVVDVRTGRGAFGVIADLEGQNMEFSREELE